MIDYKKKYIKYKKKYINLKNKKHNLKGGGKKKFKSIDNIISSKNVIAKYQVLKKNFQSQRLKSLKILLNKQKYYVDVRSNKQIITLFNMGLNESSILNRLLALLGKKINPRKRGRIFQLLRKSKNDDEVYSSLRKIIIADKFKIYNTDFSLKAEAMAHWIGGQLMNWTYNRKLLENKKWLDFGCGNGRRTREINKYLNLNEKNIFTADVDSWHNYKEDRIKPYNFIKIEPNKKLPIKSNNFDIVSLIMVLHHVEDIDNLLRELNRIIKLNGYVYVREHDAFTDSDKMLVDVEHSMYGITYYNEKNFKKDYYCRCFNFIEVVLLFEKYGFQYIWGKIASDNFKADITITRSNNNIFKKIKNI